VFDDFHLVESGEILKLIAYLLEHINAKNKIQIGTEFSLNHENNNQSQLDTDRITRVTLIDYNGDINTFQNFISWKHNFNDNITMVAGLHNMNVLLNNKSTLEPRIALNWKLDNTSSVHAGYGKHSTMKNIHNYFTRIQQPDGSIIEPNKNFGLLKADHYVLGYDKNISENVRAKVELYYQYLYNLPVENNDCFKIIGLPENTIIRIFDKSGENVFSANNYGVSNCWQGKDSRGVNLKEGTYWYFLENHEARLSQKGFVFLKR
jgi:gliding motility-associated-like protein